MAIALAYCLMYKGVLQKDIICDHLAYSRLLEHIATSLIRACTNGFCWSKEVQSTAKMIKVASCMSLVATLVNHSCNPNVIWHISDGIIHYNSLRSIKVGESLTICYGPRKSNEFNWRQNELLSHYCFQCRCEACMTEVANMDDTLKCQSSTGQCSGPLVLSQLNTCLECGHKWPMKNTQIEQLKETLKRSSDKFKRTILKLHQDNIDKFQRNKSEKVPDRFKRDKVSLETSVKLNQAVITQCRLDKLEKHLSIFSSVIYGASYHLLEKCTLLLKVCVLQYTV